MGEAQDENKGGENKTKFFVERIFLAVPINERGERDDKVKEVTKTSSKKEEK